MMNINQIIPEFIVKDIKAMVSYYQQYFDFRIEATDSEEGDYTWVQLSNGSCIIMMQEIEATKREISDLYRHITGTDLLMIKLSSAEATQDLYHRFDSIKDSIYMDIRITEYGSCEFGVKDPEGRYIIISG